MQRSSFLRAYFGVCLAVLAYVGLGFLLPGDVRGVWKDAIPLVAGTAVAALAAIWQMRLTYLTALRESHKRAAESVQASIAYLSRLSPDLEEYRQVIAALRTTADEMSVNSKELRVRGLNKDDWDYKPLQTIADLLEAFERSDTWENRQRIQRQILLVWETAQYGISRELATGVLWPLFARTQSIRDAQKLIESLMRASQQELPESFKQEVVDAEFEGNDNEEEGRMTIDRAIEIVKNIVKEKTTLQLSDSCENEIRQLMESRRSKIAELTEATFRSQTTPMVMGMILYAERNGSQDLEELSFRFVVAWICPNHLFWFCK